VSTEGAPVYQFDPHKRPDSEFQPGSLSLLVAGNEGRLLDARRTPVRILELNLDEGTFELEIQAFEDSGARWSMPFEDAARFQFALGSAGVSPQMLEAYTEAVRRLDRPLVLEADPGSRTQSAERIAAAREHAAEWLDAEGLGSVDIAPHITSREGDPRCAGLLHAYLSELELAEMDAAFSAAFVSNPRAGELVKGHAIVLAELGLCPFRGKVVRSAGLFDGDWSGQRRAEHLIARLAFTQALWARTTPSNPPLYRAMASDGVLHRHRTSSFVSATFSIEVATDHFRGAATTQTAALLRQPLPQRRALMTFLETPAMSRQFKEAEAVLIGTTDSVLF
jgi:hypothetical protein